MADRSVDALTASTPPPPWFAAYDRRMHVLIVLAAVLPILLGLSRSGADSAVAIVVNIAAWAVFVVDLVVHVRLRRHYLRTGVGVFDLSVVILTAPWFLVPGLVGSQVLVLARLGRLARLLVASPGARRAFQRLGRVGLVALAMLLLASWIAYVAERPTNDQFATYGDALWWGIVTLTTVGYGDIVPHTPKGRIAGVFLMITGLGTLGILSGTMASFFRTSPRERVDGSEGTGPDAAAGPDRALDEELEDVRRQLAAIADRLAARRGDPPS